MWNCVRSNKEFRDYLTDLRSKDENIARTAYFNLKEYVVNNSKEKQYSA